MPWLCATRHNVPAISTHLWTLLTSSDPSLPSGCDPQDRCNRNQLPPGKESLSKVGTPRKDRIGQALGVRVFDPYFLLKTPRPTGQALKGQSEPASSIDGAGFWHTFSGMGKVGFESLVCFLWDLQALEHHLQQGKRMPGKEVSLARPHWFSRVPGTQPR